MILPAILLYIYRHSSIPPTLSSSFSVCLCLFLYSIPVLEYKERTRGGDCIIAHSGDAWEIPFFFPLFLPFKKAPKVASVGLRYCQSKSRLTVRNSTRPRFGPGSVGQDISSQLLRQPQTLPVLSRFCLFISFWIFFVLFLLTKLIRDVLVDMGVPI
jgi:hypothetical protein